MMDLSERVSELESSLKTILSLALDRIENITTEEYVAIDAALVTLNTFHQTGRKWPSERDVGRFGDMSTVEHLRVGLDSDNDVYVSVWGEDGGASVEFCTVGSGGGKSPRTREALIALMVAMEQDNQESPHKDWWAQREIRK